MKIERDKETRVRVISVDSDEVKVRVLDGKNAGVEFSIELFLSDSGDESYHDIEVDDIAFVKLRMAN